MIFGFSKLGKSPSLKIHKKIKNNGKKLFSNCAGAVGQALTAHTIKKEIYRGRKDERMLSYIQRKPT